MAARCLWTGRENQVSICSDKPGHFFSYLSIPSNIKNSHHILQVILDIRSTAILWGQIRGEQREMAFEKKSTVHRLVRLVQVSSRGHVVTGPNGRRGMVISQTEDYFRRIYSTNSKGVSSSSNPDVSLLEGQTAHTSKFCTQSSNCAYSTWCGLGDQTITAHSSEVSDSPRLIL